MIKLHNNKDRCLNGQPNFTWNKEEQLEILYKMLYLCTIMLILKQLFLICQIHNQSHNKYYGITNPGFIFIQHHSHLQIKVTLEQSL